MILYFSCFAASTLFTYLAGNVRTRVRTFNMRNFFSACAIFIPCFLAAVRDSTIGTDIAMYSDRLFLLATRYNDLLEYYKHADTELVYGTITFFLGHIGNRYIYYFVLQLLVIGPIYITMMEKESRKYAWMGVMIYMFWLYPFSLNIMRQSIAMSILVFCYRYVEKRDVKRYAVGVLFACGFHITAICGLLVYIINVLTSYNLDIDIKNRFIRQLFRRFLWLNKVLIMGFAVIIVIAGANIIQLAIALSGMYSTQLIFMDSSGLDYIFAIQMMIVLMILYLGKSKYDENIKFLLYIILLGSVLYQFKANYSQMYRISMYFIAFLTIIVPKIMKVQNARNRLLTCSVLVGVSMFNFWYYIVHRLWHAVYPYTSQFLGI